MRLLSRRSRATCYLVVDRLGQAVAWVVYLGVQVVQPSRRFLTEAILLALVGGVVGGW
jgi:hypothetical protein